MLSCLWYLSTPQGLTVLMQDQFADCLNFCQQGAAAKFAAPACFPAGSLPCCHECHLLMQQTGELVDYSKGGSASLHGGGVCPECFVPKSLQPSQASYFVDPTYSAGDSNLTVLISLWSDFTDKMKSDIPCEQLLSIMSLTAAA